MPGPIFYPRPELAAIVVEATRQQPAAALDMLLTGNAYFAVSDPPAKSADQLTRIDPMNLAAYGISRPHVDGKMAPPGLPWVGKAKGRKRK